MLPVCLVSCGMANSVKKGVLDDLAIIPSENPDFAALLVLHTSSKQNLSFEEIFHFSIIMLCVRT